VEPRQNDNEFLEVGVKISASDLEYNREFVSQLDTASPISLIKLKFIPSNLITQNTDNRYKGLNGSALEILGQIEAEITKAGSNANKIKLRVVPNYTMKCDIILGRDAIRSLDIVTIKRDEKREYEMPEILSIDSSVKLMIRIN